LVEALTGEPMLAGALLGLALVAVRPYWFIPVGSVAALILLVPGYNTQDLH
jgi:hypothetical protein